MSNQLELKVKKPFGNIVRENVVLIAPLSEGKIALGAKSNYYPPSIYRLLGGGVKSGESFKQAAQREMREETNANIQLDRFAKVFDFYIKSTDADGNSYNNHTVIFAVELDSFDHLRASDDVSSIVIQSRGEFKELVQAYHDLPDDLWYIGDEGEFCWGDYGRLYAPIHKAVLEKLLYKA